MDAGQQDKSDPSSESMVFSQGWFLEDEVPGKIVQVPFVKISVEDLCQDLLERFSVAAVQDPCGRLSVQGVHRRYSLKIFVRDLEVRSL